MHIGRHINTSMNFIDSVRYANSIHCAIMQIFMYNPQKTVSKKKPYDVLQKFNLELIKYNMKLVIHGSYTINLCHPVHTSRFNTSTKSLINDLESSIIFADRCIGVIIHMGKNVETLNISYADAINNYITNLQYVLKNTNEKSKIIIETGAGQGTEICNKIDEIAILYNKLSKSERERISFCVDTCHIWASGYDISTVDGVNKYFGEFDKKIGIEKIACIHFNNSKTDFNSHVDRHADLLYGKIDKNGLKNIARLASKHGIHLIMETPLDSIDPKTGKNITFDDEYNIVKKWIK